MTVLGEAMNGTFGGLTTEVTNVERGWGPEDEPGLLATIRVSDDAGNAVGDVERVMYRDENGNLVSYHQLMQLEAAAQGRGFASAFNAHIDDWYRSEGVDRIELDANIDVGGYSWASHGYDFADEDSAARVMGRLRDRLDAVNDDDPAVTAAAELLLRRADVESFGSDAYPTAFEVSQLGRSSGVADWLGRDVMLGSNWHGVRWL